MSLRAPLCVPVELKARARWFRLAGAVGDEGLSLRSAAPDEAEGAIEIAFHLPGDPKPIRCRARAFEQRLGEGDTERAERRDLRFLDLDEDGRARIAEYVEERLALV